MEIKFKNYRFLLILVILSIGSYARIIYVDSSSVCESADGSTWAKAFAHLQDGLKNAEKNDEIRIATGTYLTSYENRRSDNFSIPSDIKICGGYKAGTLKRFADNTETILSADFNQDDIIKKDTLLNNQNNGYRVIVCEKGNSVIIDGMIIQGGYGIDESERMSQFAGCGLFLNAWNMNNNAKIILVNCKVRNNTGSGKGSGLYFKGSFCEFSNCRFEGNRSLLKDRFGSTGGGIYIDAYAATIDKCSIVNNSALHGGGIYFNGVSCSLTNNTFSMNSSYDGGGAVRFTGNQMYITDTRFEKNISFDGCGGAVSFRGRILEIDKCSADSNNCYGTGGVVDFEGDSCNVFRSVFTDNSTQTFGGAFKVMGKKIIFDSCKFSGNRARTKHGGSIYCEGDCLVISKTVFKSERAEKGNGGALCFIGKDADVNNTKFIRDSSSRGGAVYAEQDVFRTDKRLNFENCEFNACISEENGSAISFYGNAGFIRCNFIAPPSAINTIVDNSIHNENDEIRYCGFKSRIDTMQLNYEKRSREKNSIINSRFTCSENRKFTDVVNWTGNIDNCRYNDKPVSINKSTSKNIVSMINE